MYELLRCCYQVILMQFIKNLLSTGSFLMVSALPLQGAWVQFLVRELEPTYLSCVRLFVFPWTVAHRQLCSWDSPGKNTEVGSHFLLQGIFPTEGSNPGLPHCRQILYCLSHRGSPRSHISQLKDPECHNED